MHLGPDGTFSGVNEAFAELFGSDPQELVGKHWRTLHHDEKARRLEQDILVAVCDGYWSAETIRLTEDRNR